MRGDPRWIFARYPAKCAGCGRRIGKGASAWWYPRGGRVECDGCGQVSSARFQAEVDDERALSVGGWS